MDEDKDKRPWLSRDQFIKAINEYKKKHGIKRQRLTKEELDEAVKEFLESSSSNA